MKRDGDNVGERHVALRRFNEDEAIVSLYLPLNFYLPLTQISVAYNLTNNRNFCVSIFVFILTAKKLYEHFNSL